jgi:hypothetical protein
VTNYKSSLKLVALLGAPLLLLACGSSSDTSFAGYAQELSATPSVTLVRASNAQAISGFDPIADNATITLSALPTQELSVRGNPSGSIGSMRFDLDGSYSHVESIAPYSLCGDATSSYTACPQLNVAGAHTLTVTEFSGSGATGTAGTPTVVHFTVSGGTSEPPPNPPPSGPVAFPLKLSTNQRYLVDQNNAPFPILGDSGWEVAHNLVPADQDSYLADRVSRGFNAVLVEAIEHKFTTKKPPMDFASNLPFTRRLDGATYTGSPNGTDSTSGSGTIVSGPTFGADPYSNINAQAPDFTYPGSAYWTEMDSYLGRAAARGLVVFMFPAYVGFGGGDEGWMRELVANDAVIGAGGFAGQSWSNASKSRVWNYGAWLAQHYAAYSNIVWVLGGDFGSFNGAQSNSLANLLAGMKSIPNQKSVLWTSHWARPSYGSDLSQFASALNLESVYTNSDAAAQTRAGYAHTPARPTFVIEGLYEDNPNVGGPVRKLQWPSLFGTPAGQFFGATAMWAVGSQWRSAMDTTGTRQQALLNAFVRSIPWYNLVPSGLNGQKTIAVNNGGTLGQSDYVACAASSAVAGCYVPPAWSRGTLGIDATVLAGPFRARWLNPTTGAYTLISSNVSNSGVATFTPPGNNGSGASDWVLVLDTAGFVPSTPAPNAPPTFSAAASASESPVTTTSVGLSALAGDDGGEAALSYTWATTGTPPAAVAFSLNDSNAAKNTVATFSKVGAYSFKVTASDAQGLTASSTVNVTVSQKLSAITVAPGSASVAPGGTQAFSATGNDQFGAAMSSAPSFTWAVSGGGSINASGAFTAAGSSGGPFSVTADSAGVRGTASVTVGSTPAPQQFSLGQTSVLGTVDSGNGGWLIAQPITLGKVASLQSLSFYVSATSGSLRMGVYDASGPSQMPGRKLAETAELTPAQVGWATGNVTQTATLQPGKYWIVYLCSSNAMQSRRTPNGGGEAYYYQFAYGALPATFSTGALPDPVSWSFFATFSG